MNKFVEWFDARYMKDTKFGNGKIKNGIYEDDFKIIIKQETGYEWISKRDNKKIFINGVIIERYENGNKLKMLHDEYVTLTLLNPNAKVVFEYKEKYKLYKIESVDMDYILGDKENDIILKIGDDK